MLRQILLVVTFILVLSTLVLGESDFYKEFKVYYNELGSELATKPPAEVAEVSNFVYKKDVATFTFTGRMYLLRHLDDRPTTAIFIGEGHARVDIPSALERQSMWYASGDSVVDESFETAFLDFSDDFDLKIREQFTFVKDNLPWRDFNKTQQGEFFFKPVIMHEYDNYFELVRSHYERAEDGYFWIHFNRYVFSFDPNRPEEVVVGYEHEGGDLAPTDGVVMQRMEHNKYDEYGMSEIPYPTTIVNRTGTLTMGGMDGTQIDDADITVSMQINRDSLRFISMYLHYNLKLDSMYYNGQPVDFWRRNTFTFLGIMLPEYVHKGDTVELRLFYHGKDFHPALPFVEDPTPSLHDIAFAVPKGFDYLMPAYEPTDPQDKKHEWYRCAPAEPYRMLLWEPAATGYDTITVVSSVGLNVNFLNSSSISKTHEGCFIPQETFQNTTVAAFDFIAGRLGIPMGAFTMWVYPQAGVSMPGLMSVSQVTCYKDQTGGLPMAAALEAGRQWFGGLMKPRSDREYWLIDAVPDYLSIMHTTSLNPGVGFGELARRRNEIYTQIETDENWPLGAGRRVEATERQAKGCWIMHMLHYLMFDVENRSDRTFLRFLYELKDMVNNAQYTNEDIVRLAEKHYGEPLDWFFHEWLFQRDIPEYDVDYRIEQREGGYSVVGTANTSGVASGFKMPIIMRVEFDNGESDYKRVMVGGSSTAFDIGPFASKPKELIFNEFYSVLSKDKVNKSK